MTIEIMITILFILCAILLIGLSVLPRYFRQTAQHNVAPHHRLSLPTNSHEHLPITSPQQYVHPPQPAPNINPPPLAQQQTHPATRVDPQPMRPMKRTHPPSSSSPKPEKKAGSTGATLPPKTPPTLNNLMPYCCLATKEAFLRSWPRKERSELGMKLLEFTRNRQYEPKRHNMLSLSYLFQLEPDNTSRARTLTKALTTLFHQTDEVLGEILECKIDSLKKTDGAIQELYIEELYGLSQICITVATNHSRFKIPLSECQKKFGQALRHINIQYSRDEDPMAMAKHAYDIVDLFLDRIDMLTYSFSNDDTWPLQNSQRTILQQQTQSMLRHFYQDNPTIWEELAKHAEHLRGIVYCHSGSSNPVRFRYQRIHFMSHYIKRLNLISRGLMSGLVSTKRDPQTWSQQGLQYCLENLKVLILYLHRTQQVNLNIYKLITEQLGFNWRHTLYLIFYTDTPSRRRVLERLYREIPKLKRPLPEEDTNFDQTVESTMLVQPTVRIDFYQRSLQFASEEKRNNKAQALMILEDHGLELQYVSDELKDDIEVVKTAVASASDALQYAHPRLQNDPEVLAIAANAPNGIVFPAPDQIDGNCQSLFI